MGACDADAVWPAGGVLPPDTESGSSGYATNRAVRTSLTAALEHLPGIAAWNELRPGVLLITGESGIRFTVGPPLEMVKHLRRVHGGPGPGATLALVAGGHPPVPRIACAIAA